MKSWRRLVPSAARVLPFFLSLAVVMALLPGPTLAARGGSHRSHSSVSTRSIRAAHPRIAKVHVRGYYRKDGTYVRSHERAAAGTASVSPRSSGARSAAPRSLASARSHSWSGSSGVKRDGHGRIKRSEEAKRQFRRHHPCPCTGRTTGPCPGYVIDHIRALKRGGADDPSNMQWQTAAAAKAKDKVE